MICTWEISDLDEQSDSDGGIPFLKQFDDTNQGFYREVHLDHFAAFHKAGHKDKTP